jgi:hypothetical protein
VVSISAVPEGAQGSTPDGRLSATIAAAIGNQLAIRVLDQSAAASVPSGFTLGDLVFSATLRSGGEPASLALSQPMTFAYHPSADDLQKTGGSPDRIRLALWSGSGWVALPCSGDSNTISCSAFDSGTYAEMISPAPSSDLEAALPNGYFFKEANGFGGAGDAGYAVTDDDQATFWTEFQRYGGPSVVGYPISNRFVYRGFLTQAFQRLALQWRPEMGQAVPINVLDELSGRGSDAWLDAQRQVPPPDDTSADAGLDFDAVYARHVALLDAYPALEQVYLSDDNSLTRLGLPLSVKNYGPFVAARFQRGVLQLWQVDTSFASAGTIIGGNAGDLAKEVGLWPTSAIVPAPISATANAPGATP